MLSAIPWGVVADKKGRRLVIVIGIIGLLLNDGWYYFVCESFSDPEQRMRTHETNRLFL